MEHDCDRVLKTSNIPSETTGSVSETEQSLTVEGRHRFDFFWQRDLLYLVRTDARLRCCRRESPSLEFGGSRATEQVLAFCRRRRHSSRLLRSVVCSFLRQINWSISHACSFSVFSTLPPIGPWPAESNSPRVYDLRIPRNHGFYCSPSVHLRATIARFFRRDHLGEAEGLPYPTVPRISSSVPIGLSTNYALVAFRSEVESLD